MSDWRAGTPGYDWHSKTLTKRSNSFLNATFREMISVSSLFVSIFPTSMRSLHSISFLQYYITVLRLPLMATPFRLIDMIAYSKSSFPSLFG